MQLRRHMPTSRTGPLAHQHALAPEGFAQINGHTARRDATMRTGTSVSDGGACAEAGERTAVHARGSRCHCTDGADALRVWLIATLFTRQGTGWDGRCQRLGCASERHRWSRPHTARKKKVLVCRRSQCSGGGRWSGHTAVHTTVGDIHHDLCGGGTGVNASLDRPRHHHKPTRARHLCTLLTGWDVPPDQARPACTASARALVHARPSPSCPRCPPWRRTRRRPARTHGTARRRCGESGTHRAAQLSTTAQRRGTE